MLGTFLIMTVVRVSLPEAILARERRLVGRVPFGLGAVGDSGLGVGVGGSLWLVGVVGDSTRVGDAEDELESVSLRRWSTWAAMANASSTAMLN